MVRFPPVPTTVSKSVQLGPFNVVLYCTVYDFPLSLGKDRLKKPLGAVGAPWISKTNCMVVKQVVLTVLVTATPQMLRPVAVEVLVLEQLAGAT